MASERLGLYIPLALLDPITDAEETEEDEPQPPRKKAKVIKTKRIMQELIADLTEKNKTLEEHQEFHRRMMADIQNELGFLRARNAAYKMLLSSLKRNFSTECLIEIFGAAQGL